MAEKKAKKAKELNILQRINEVRKAVDYVKKEEKKIDGQYKAVSHDAVTAVLHEHLVTHGVVVMPTVEHSKTVDAGKKTGKGTPIVRVEMDVNVVFLNVDDKTDNVTMTVYTHGEDTGDKGPGKALSYAVKYAKLKMFDLETGEDDEGRIESVPEKLTEKSYQMLIDLCIELNMDVDLTLESMATNVYKVKTINEINEQWAEDAAKRLRAKAAADAGSRAADSAITG